MPDELLPTAIRVMNCFATQPPQEPDPTDVAWLRVAVSSEAKKWLPHDLAAYIIKREIKRLRRVKIAVATQ